MRGAWCVVRGAWCVVALALAAGTLRAQAIVPRPTEVTIGRGEFALGDRVTIVLRGDERRLRDAVDILRSALRRGGVTTRVRSGALARPGEIALELPRQGVAADSEAYDVFVRTDGITLRAGSARGMIWAVQTLRQMLPPAFEATPRAVGAARAHIRITEMHDAPRFAWRGAMIDAGRHFLSPARVKRFLDIMSLYKLNVLHWHLTDDQGWRIDVPRFPRLTSVGAWRTEADGSRYGGFYSRMDVIGIVEHARRLGITVIPEIEMPGHASAALAAYPWLGCDGRAIPVPSAWGVFADIFCVGKPRVLAFLDSVIADVAPLFPAPFFHIGGDEVPKQRWQACAECQELMRREGLHNEAELQSWFTRRMAGVLAGHGKRLIGWDEITEGGLPPGVVVQVWRDMAHAESTANRGQDVIASPTSHMYLDYSQSSLPLAQVYSFDPLARLTPAAARHILGGEAPLWSESINDANHDLMAFPRLLAVAEALWTSGTRDFANFRDRLAWDQYPRLRALGVVPGPEDRDVARLRVEVDTMTGRARVFATLGTADVVMRYTLDGSVPNARSPVYTEAIATDSGTLHVRAFVGDLPMLVERRLHFEPHLARSRPLRLAAPPSPRYLGTGPRTLTDGLTGSSAFNDGLWQGWQGVDLDVVIDLGEARDVRTVTGSFLQDTRSWILLPGSMDVSLSLDSATWTQPRSATHDVPAEQVEPTLKRLTIEEPAGTQARYVRVIARNYGPLPPWHGSAGGRSWIFADEILVH